MTIAYKHITMINAHKHIIFCSFVMVHPQIYTGFWAIIIIMRCYAAIMIMCFCARTFDWSITRVYDIVFTAYYLSHALISVHSDDHESVWRVSQILNTTSYPFCVLISVPFWLTTTCIGSSGHCKTTSVNLCSALTRLPGELLLWYTSSPLRISLGQMVHVFPPWLWKNRRAKIWNL